MSLSFESILPKKSIIYYIQVIAYKSKENLWTILKTPQTMIFFLSENILIYQLKQFLHDRSRPTIFTHLFLQNTPNFSPRKKALLNGSISEADINKFEVK